MPIFSQTDEAKEKRGPAKIVTTLHIQKLVHNSGRKYKAERAIKEIVKAGQALMGTEEVKIDQDLNSRIWYRSRANPPVRVRVVFERKASESKRQSKAGQMITVASYKDVASFKGLQTEKVNE
jgi:large subunit ribosomal protein L31e